MEIEMKLGPGLAHLKTEEGQKRFDAAIESRTQADYNCFYLLRELFDNEMLTKSKLRASLQAEVGMGITETEADECAEEWSQRVKEVLQKRNEADIEFTHAMRGT